jgi:tetratricopeptide (TPR) repeat protein
VLAALRADPSLQGPLLQEAIDEARRFPQDPAKLNDASWKVVSRPGRDAEDHRRALVEAEEACRLVPDDGAYLNTLGVAHYRVARYDRAVESLTRSDALNRKKWKQPQAADLAFLAMAQYRLGHQAQAEELLRALRGAASGSRPGQTDETRAFLREAEQVLAGKVPKQP